MDLEEITLTDPDGGALVVIQPGQRYVQTHPFPGLTTCLRCACLVDEQLLGQHDASHGET